MLYQIGLIVLIVYVALVLSKRFNSTKNGNDLIYEDEMDDEELNSIDEEIHWLIISSFKDLRNCLQANTTIRANGTPVITTEVWRAVNPPAYSKTAAKTPNKIAQVILESIGESSFIFDWLLDESIDATNAPESDEVTKKVTINIKDRIDKNWAIG